MKRKRWLNRSKPEQARRAFDLGKRILGLSVPLRLALTAQATGAKSIALANGAGKLRALLADPRLKLPIYDEVDRPSFLEYRATSPSIRVPANYVVHRSTFVRMQRGASWRGQNGPNVGSCRDGDG